MRKLAHVMPEAIARGEVLRAARAQRVLRNWEAIVGPELAKRSQPDRYERGTVWVSVAGSAWAQELRMLEPTILAKVAEFCGDPHLVVALRFGVRAPRERPEGMQAKPRLTPDPDLETMTIAEIRDRRLRQWQAKGVDSGSEADATPRTEP